MISIRDGRADDARPLSAAFAAMGWARPPERFAGYVEAAAARRMRFLVAELDGALAGHAQILRLARHAPAAARGLPEVMDLNVLAPMRRRGVATALMDAAEASAWAAPGLCVGTGLTADYAPALALYLGRGYRPDGGGATWRGHPLAHGQPVTVDDDLTLYLQRAG